MQREANRERQVERERDRQKDMGQRNREGQNIYPLREGGGGEDDIYVDPVFFITVFPTII